MRLTHQGIGPEPTRRRATMDELRAGPAGASHADQFVAAFQGVRLLDRRGTDGDSIEICHEALVRAWSRLADWLKDGRDLRVLGSWLGEATADWLAADRADEALRPDARAEQAADAIAGQLLAVTADEAAFVAASLDRQRAIRTEERRLRRLRLMAITAAVLLVVAGVVVLVTVRSLQQSWELADVTENLRLAAAARADSSTSRDRAAALAIEASNGEPVTDGRGALVDVLAAPGPTAYIAGSEGSPATDLAVLVPGDRAVAVVADGRDSIRLIDAGTGQAVSEPLATGVESSERVAVPPAGDRVVVGGNGEVAVVDLSSRQALRLPGGAPNRILAVETNGDAVAALGVDGTLTTWTDAVAEPATTRPFGDTSTTAIALAGTVCCFSAR